MRNTIYYHSNFPQNNIIFHVIKKTENTKMLIDIKSGIESKQEIKWLDQKGEMKGIMAISLLAHHQLAI